MPEESVIASMMSIDNLKVEKLVREFLTAQSLKILPQAPFGDAVTQFVDKDDKHAMETFVNESLAMQLTGLLAQDSDEENDIDSVMERIRAKAEAEFASGLRKRPRKKGKLKPRPENWDSDMDGEWEEQPGAFEITGGDEDNNDATGPISRRGRAGTAVSDDDASIISAAPAGKKAPAKTAPAKKAPAKPRISAKAKAPVKTPARGRKKIAEPSDDEDDDVIMLDDELPPPKSQPKRTAAKGRQTQLNFSQSQTKTQTARELSDDEISDDDDAFEPMTTSTRRR
jgi:double-strand break repair protein MRE11